MFITTENAYGTGGMLAAGLMPAPPRIGPRRENHLEGPPDWSPDGKRIICLPTRAPAAPAG
jgi:hypothetical protein